MAVNIIDKLQFLSFIFAVLLSATVHFIAFRLEEDNYALAHKNSAGIGPNNFRHIMFFILSRWQLATVLNF